MRKPSPLAIFGLLVLVAVLWLVLSVGRLLTGTAAWGPEVGGTLPNGVEVHFQARPAGFETDDRLTVRAPGAAREDHMVDQVHAGFAHVVLRYLDRGDRVWVESDGKVGASIDLTTGDFRAEGETQHDWAVLGAGTVLDSGDTSSVLSFLSPW